MEDQKLKRKTLILLSVLNLDYWCEPDEREEILNIYWKNEKESYVVVNDDEDIDSYSNTGLMVYREESFIERIWNKLKNFFRRD